MLAAPPGKSQPVSSMRAAGSCFYCGRPLPKGSPCVLETVYGAGTVPLRRRACLACVPYVPSFWQALAGPVDEGALRAMFSAHVAAQEVLRKAPSYRR